MGDLLQVVGANRQTEGGRERLDVVGAEVSHDAVIADGLGRRQASR
jgi:hypothetical protein